MEGNKQKDSPRPISNGINKNWSRKAVVYQIYPRSFKDTDGDGVGDLEGIIEKLDYLNDGTNASLGITAIWLNPIYKSPMKDFGYDISDYRDIDPIFGNLDIFDQLVAKAHKRGIKIIMDFVPNHTSSEHPWFQESKKAKDNSKRDWYIWRDPKTDGSPPNNWLSVFGGSAWTRDEKTGQYYMHSFLSDQPDLNWRNKDVRDEMADVLRFWLKRGVDGFRTDAVYHLIKDDEFRDEPPNPNYDASRDEPYNALLHVYSQGRPELTETANTLCNVLGEQSKNIYMVSEAYLGLPQMMELYKACDNSLHAPFNFNLMMLPWNAAAFKKFIDEYEEKLGPDDWPNYTLGNHDRSRLATRLGQDRARLAAMMQFTLRGMPFVYYGDELGMEDVQMPADATIDPWGKNLPEFGVGRDPERTPMQWNSNPNAGFSDVTPWLPVTPDHKEKNVERESRDPNSMLSFFKELIHYRKNSPALLSGSYKPMESDNEHVFVFRRECTSEKLLIAINFSDSEQIAGLSVDGTLLCNTHRGKCGGEKIQTTQLKLKPHKGLIIRLNQ
ncbi:alpha-amylase [Candidatus Roizmanbacteria bacterium CG22_combo_CG10-13_8_21_14_all_38_20]|uniref:Alpha-amylase n=1 Tax=Candidatus Roizmanbacteria bacterium CG22_combo_CG10-13_8_21_14_all_38_20 TaxID=1974862 RepID=A0A2H0BTM6_9BACT|nr:MAG: alpha-amylase [Candidatus Roizmanbacteria bacterium CG22_combo_CG10-13_8_21_14_all_38_20]